MTNPTLEKQPETIVFNGDALWRLHSLLSLEGYSSDEKKRKAGLSKGVEDFLFEVGHKAEVLPGATLTKLPSVEQAGISVAEEVFRCAIAEVGITYKYKRHLRISSDAPDAVPNPYFISDMQLEIKTENTELAEKLRKAARQALPESIEKAVRRELYSSEQDAINAFPALKGYDEQFQPGAGAITNVADFGRTTIKFSFPACESKPPIYSLLFDFSDKDALARTNNILQEALSEVVKDQVKREALVNGVLRVLNQGFYHRSLNDDLDLLSIKGLYPKYTYNVELQCRSEDPGAIFFVMRNTCCAIKAPYSTLVHSESGVSAAVLQRADGGKLATYETMYRIGISPATTETPAQPTISLVSHRVHTYDEMYKPSEFIENVHPVLLKEKANIKMLIDARRRFFSFGKHEIDGAAALGILNFYPEDTALAKALLGWRWFGKAIKFTDSQLVELAALSAENKNIADILQSNTSLSGKVGQACWHLIDEIEKYKDTASLQKQVQQLIDSLGNPAIVRTLNLDIPSNFAQMASVLDLVVQKRSDLGDKVSGLGSFCKKMIDTMSKILDENSTKFIGNSVLQRGFLRSFNRNRIIFDGSGSDGLLHRVRNAFTRVVVAPPAVSVAAVSRGTAAITSMLPENPAPAIRDSALPVSDTSGTDDGASSEGSQSRPVTPTDESAVAKAHLPVPVSDHADQPATVATVGASASTVFHRSSDSACAREVAAEKGVSGREGVATTVNS